MKTPFLYLFLIVLQTVAAAAALSSYDHSGNDTDYLALLAIKSQLHHSDGVLRSWNHSVHHCHWEGVTCWHKYDRVTRLDLNSRGLSGSFGSVFKGKLDRKPVAVKVINLQHHSASKSFIAECKALRNVRHRNLVGIITACSSIDFHRNDFRALVYEFMANGSLDKWLNGTFGNLNLRQRLDITIDVANALNYLHNECETPIVHCDLKPSNILLDQDMVAHVGDFGLTRFLTQPRHPNQSSTLGIMGTIGYAPPEYGLGSEASTAGDVYSYGILLLELMTGKSPTDSMFKEDHSLHMYAQAALPDQVMQIVDPTLEEDNITEEADNTRATQDALHRKQECIVSVLNVGVLCSNHLPQDRMKIPEAISGLQAARKYFLNTRNGHNRPARG